MSTIIMVFALLNQTTTNFIATKSVPGFLRPAMLTTYAVVIGLLLSAIQFYPGYKYTTEFSPRTDSKSGWDWATSWSIHEEEAFSLLIDRLIIDVREGKLHLPVSREKLVEITGLNKPKLRAKIIELE